MTVTSAATPMVRSVTVRYTASVSTVRMLSSVHTRSISPVNAFVVHRAVISNAARAPM
jgi:hypothetical protein